MLQIKLLIGLVLLGAFFCWSAQTNDIEGYDFFLMEGSTEIHQDLLFDQDLFLPDAFKQTLDFYRQGKYRLAILELKKFVAMGTPDDRTPIYYFMLGECYSQLGLEEFANYNYVLLIEHFKENSLRPFAIFRLQEYFYNRGEFDKSEPYFRQFQNEYPVHRLIHAVEYTQSKQFFRERLYDHAFKLTSKIKQVSSFFLPAAFLKGLCCAEQKNYEKAILFFDYVVKQNKKNALHFETINMLGNIFYRLKRYPVALKYFESIPLNHPQFYNAQLKSCKIHMTTGNTPASIFIAEKMLNQYSNSEYVFEIVYLLEESYRQSGEREKMGRLQHFISGYIHRSQLNFEIFREKSRLSVIRKTWDSLLLQEINRNGKTPETIRLSNQMDSELVKVEILEKTLDNLWIKLNPGISRAGAAVKSGMAEIRFLELMRSEEARINSEILFLNNRINVLIAEPEKEDELNAARGQLSRQYNKLAETQKIREDVIHLSMGSEEYMHRIQMAQTKFVDWGFIKINDLKARIIANYVQTKKLQERVQYFHQIAPRDLSEDLEKLQKVVPKKTQSGEKPLPTAPPPASKPGEEKP